MKKFKPSSIPNVSLLIMIANITKYIYVNKKQTELLIIYIKKKRTIIKAKS